MNSKKRCTFCKKYFPADSIISVPVGNFCSKEHLIEYGIKSTSKLIKKSKEIIRKKHAKEKREYRSSRLKTRKEATKTACHAYIRARDRDKPCICCGEPLKPDYQAGHFKESGNNPLIRYDEDNIHGQNLNCNFFKGGDSGMYRVNLIERIGIERVEKLEIPNSGTLKRTVEDYLAIEQYYKKKLKALNTSLDKCKRSL